jgi:hypothetical protein
MTPLCPCCRLSPPKKVFFASHKFRENGSAAYTRHDRANSRVRLVGSSPRPAIIKCFYPMGEAGKREVQTTTEPRLVLLHLMIQPSPNRCGGVLIPIIRSSKATLSAEGECHVAAPLIPWLWSWSPPLGSISWFDIELICRVQIFSRADPSGFGLP